MPHYWIAYQTREDLQELLANGQWAEFKQRVFEDMHARGIGLDDVYFEERGRVAYALIHTGDQRTEDVKKLVSDWQVSEEVELFTVEEMVARNEPGRPPSGGSGQSQY